MSILPQCPDCKRKFTPSMMFCSKCGHQLKPSHASDTANYYDLLGLFPNATHKEIVHASQVILGRLTNAQCQDATVALRELGRRVEEAANVLSNSDLRQSYDRMSAQMSPRIAPGSGPSAPPKGTQSPILGSFQSTEASGVGSAPPTPPPGYTHTPDWDIGQTGTTTVQPGPPATSPQDTVKHILHLLGIGFFAWMLVVLLIFPLSYLLLIPAIRGAFFPEGRWVGLGTTLLGMLLWVVSIPLLYIGLLMLQLIFSGIRT